MQKCTSSLDDFIDTIIKKTDKLTTHHFVSKHQAEYLTNLKQQLGPSEAIAILDFTENYSFIVQDAAQGFHWENSQATLHPFAVYFKQKGELRHESLCIVSDRLQHDTVSVNRFQQNVLDYIKQILPSIKKIYYFSDGDVSHRVPAGSLKSLKSTEFTNLEIIP